MNLLSRLMQGIKSYFKSDKDRIAQACNSIFIMEPWEEPGISHQYIDEIFKDL